jgi:hypothetical protein
MEPVPKFSEFLKLHKLNLNFRSGVMCTNLDLWRAHWREEEIPEDNNKDNGHLQTQQPQLEDLEHQEVSMITCL